MRFREEIGKILNMYIPENGWDDVFKEINLEARPDLGEIHHIIKEICKKIDEEEKAR